MDYQITKNSNKYIITKHRQIYTGLLFVLHIGLFIGLSSVSIVNAQTVIGARELALGQAATALENSSHSVFSNPAMVPETGINASFFGVRYFGFAEITDIAATVTFPTRTGIFGAGVHRYGYDLFNESRVRIVYKNMFRGFRFGVILNYSHVVQGGGYGNAGALGMDLGLAAPILPGLWIGSKATNINQPEYGSLNNEELPRIMSIGLSYNLSEVALFSSDLVKDVRFPLSYRSGIEIRVIENLFARAGVTTSPQTISLGFGYNTSFWGANIAVQRHENVILGYSPAIDFNIRW